MDEYGKFTAEAGPYFAGKLVLDDGVKSMIQKLSELDLLIGVENYVHKYPYDWRTKKPIIMRLFSTSLYELVLL